MWEKLANITSLLEAIIVNNLHVHYNNAMRATQNTHKSKRSS